MYILRASYESDVIDIDEDNEFSKQKSGGQRKKGSRKQRCKRTQLRIRIHINVGGIVDYTGLPKSLVPSASLHTQVNKQMAAHKEVRQVS